LSKNATNSKTSEIRKKKPTTNSVKTAPNLRNLETPRRRFLRKKSQRRMLIVKDKLVRVKKMELKTRKLLKKLIVKIWMIWISKQLNMKMN
jgi:hypothetical protein